jgi:hypothetical protein
LSAKVVCGEGSDEMLVVIGDDGEEGGCPCGERVSERKEAGRKREFSPIKRERMGREPERTPR